MQTKIIAAVVVVIVILLGGYWWFTTADTSAPQGDAAGDNVAPQGAVQGVSVNAAAAAARADLAAKLGVPEAGIVVTKVESKTWSDGCLGLGGAAESCLQALVEGYQVDLEVEGAPYTYRTDATGVALRLEAGPKG